MGYGIIELSGSKMKLLSLGVIQLNKFTDHALKLKRIFEKTLSLIDEYKPDDLAIEAPFFGKNVQSMLKLGRAQGVAIAAGVYKMKAVVVMASNATQSKVDATRAYGAEVVQHGTIWDEANEKAKQLCEERGLTYIHPFDDMQLITGQGTLGLEVFRDFPGVDVAVVPIGGGGLISGVSMALKASNPRIKIIGVESSDGPAMQQSVAAGRVITLDKIDCIIDGLRVKRVGDHTFSVVQRFVDDIVTLPDREIFDAMIWIMSHCKLVVEGAAAAPVAALLHGLIKAPAGSKVVAVLSGGNVNLDQIRNLKWN